MKRLFSLPKPVALGLSLISLLGLGTPLQANPEPAPATVDTSRSNHRLDPLSFDPFVGKVLQDYAVPGAVIAVVQDDGNLFLKGYGSGKPEAQNRSTKTPVSRSGRSASLSPPRRWASWWMKAN